METFLYIVFFLSCIILVVAVLLQPGKTDAGALFTSGVSSAAMNPRGTASVLSKLTIVTATVFMLSALLLTLPALTGNVSVLQTQDETNNSSTTTNSNTNTEKNSNASSNAANSSESNSESKSDKKKEDANAVDNKADEKKSEEKSDEKAEDKKDDSKDKADKKKEENK